MSYFIIIYTVCILATHASVIPNESEAQIVKYENSNNGAGNYKFSFETTNDITRKEVGHLENIGQEDEHIVVEGSYSYINVDGNTVVVNYTADKNGYHIISSPQIVPPNDFAAAAVPANVVASLLGK